MTDWSRHFEDPSMAERDQRLEIPATTSQAFRRLSRISMWQTSIRSLMGAADGRDFVMHSRIGLLHALNRNVKGLFNSGHKGTLEKAREIKTVQGISESWDESEGK